MAWSLETAKSYHNNPNQTELYQKIARAIVASHTTEAQDIEVLQDLTLELINRMMEGGE